MTKAVYGVSVDPFNPYRVASYTEEGVVKLWDLRNPNDSISFFFPLHFYNCTNLRFILYFQSLTRNCTY